MSYMQAIKSTDLIKVYGEGFKALEGINISVKEGELYTLLGPNGAGKTTFLKIVSTQLMPTSGKAYVLGYDVVSEASEIHRHISIVPQDVAAYGYYTPWEYAYYFARFRRVPKEEAKKTAERALRSVGLWNLKDRTCATLSGGEKRRAIIASALSSVADVLMLDEPTSGLDAIARRNIWSALREIVRKGITILLTTHNMEEAEMISDRLAIINKGQVIAEGSPQEVKGLVAEKYRVVLEGEVTHFSAVGSGGVVLGDRYILYVQSENEAAKLMKEALKRGLQAYVSPVTLEDVFVKLAGGFNNESS
jgi:ABC-2 type transport system ATP-binding protein